jgi:hypothetical protein
MGAPPPWENLQLWRQTRSNVIADQVRQALLHGKRLLDTAHVLSFVFHSDKQYASRGVGERHKGAEHAIRRRQISLELQTFPLALLEKFAKIHSSAYYSEAKHLPRFRAAGTQTGRSWPALLPRSK